MQAVKYKAYHLEKKEVTDVRAIQWLETGEIFIQAISREGLFLNGTDQIFRLLQFTGAHDRRGVEIYDGDLLEHKGLMFEVMWGINHAWMVRIRNIWADVRTDHHVYHPLKWALEKKHMPKIGSIYDYSKRKRRSYGFNG